MLETAPFLAVRFAPPSSRGHGPAGIRSRRGASSSRRRKSAGIFAHRRAFAAGLRARDLTIAARRLANKRRRAEGPSALNLRPPARRVARRLTAARRTLRRRLRRRVGQLLKVFYLFRHQASSAAHADAAQGQPAHADADEVPHVVREAGQHAAGLAVAALAQGHLEHRALPAMPDEPHLRRARAPLGQPDAPAQPPHVVLRHVARHDGHVRLRHLVARVREAVGQQAVVCHQQKAPRVAVQPPHREQTRLRVRLHQVHRPRPAGRVEVRAHDALRLVE